MDNIKLKGMGKYSDGLTIVSEIELSPSELKAQLKGDLSKIKQEDRVWVEYKIIKLFDSNNCLVASSGNHPYYIYGSDIVAHFPPEPKNEVKLPKKTNTQELCTPSPDHLDIDARIESLTKELLELREKLSKSLKKSLPKEKPSANEILKLMLEVTDEVERRITCDR